jgi:Putative beta-barrel porin-2, OmpL-like. bbp2
MYFKPNRILQTMAGAAMATALLAGAQAPAPSAPAATPAAAQAPATPAAAAPAPAPTWSVGPMDVSGFIDGYYSYNFNTPSAAANGQANDLYNFNDKTDQFNLSAAKLTLNHDPDPVGAHVDFIYGRTNDFINAPSANTTSADQLNYIEQAFLSLKPPKAKGFELDFGKFVTSAGAEVIEAKDNWNYSRSLLFSWAIPYWHFGARTSIPVSKTETIGVQVVNGWNNISKTNGGATVGLTSAFVKPKFTWNLNYYGGPENANTTSGFRHLIDSTLLLTPSSKFNAYINYDYGQNRDAIVGSGSTATGDTNLNHWQGVAFAAHGQVTGTQALTGRFEYFNDPNGFSTGMAQHLYEFTGTYEYKWAAGFLTRIEYRRDWSNVNFFHKNDTTMVDAQSTVTAGLIAFFGPKR